MLPSLHSSASPLDLHVLGTPPAFVLSQDQTLVLNPSELTLGISFPPVALAHSRIDCLLSNRSPGALAPVPRSASLPVSVSFSRILCPLRAPVRRADSLIIISLLPPPVNPFFSSFSALFRDFLKAFQESLSSSRSRWIGGRKVSSCSTFMIKSRKTLHCHERRRVL